MGWTTFPSNDQAAVVARSLVEQGLVACATMLPGATSLYMWEGKVCEDTETVVVLKAAATNVGMIEEYLVEHHSYQTPALLWYSAQGGLDPYMKWVLSTGR
jgi:periplasmic divalent cation tolerance protein